jgi:hypothetical protein
MRLRALQIKSFPTRLTIGPPASPGLWKVRSDRAFRTLKNARDPFAGAAGTLGGPIRYGQTAKRQGHSITNPIPDCHVQHRTKIGQVYRRCCQRNANPSRINCTGNLSGRQNLAQFCENGSRVWLEKARRPTCPPQTVFDITAVGQG